MLKEFKEFIMRGNVLDLAVGVVIGAAFTAVVDSIVKGLITPLVGFVISLVTGSKDGKFTGMKVSLGNTDLVFDFDLVVSALISFIITAFVLFMIIKAVNKLRSLGHKKEAEEEEAAPEPTVEETYLKEIRDLLQAQAEKEN